MKEKMLMRLDRDKMAANITALEATIKDLENSKPSNADSASNGAGAGKERKRYPKDSTLTPANRKNRYLEVNFEPTPAESFKLSHTVKAHATAVSGLALHPAGKPILATVSDDMTWKLWSIPSGELIMSGDGHKDWLSSCAFHPK